MNTLEPGAGGLAAPSPADDKANPLQVGRQPDPGTRSEAQQHFDSAEDSAAEEFHKLKTLDGQMKVVQKQFQGLLQLNDTVTMGDVVKSSGAIVAAGVPAVQVASSLAEVPQQPEMLQQWVKQKAGEAAQQEQQLKQALAKASWNLGLAAYKSILADSVETHHGARMAAARRGMH